MTISCIPIHRVKAIRLVDLEHGGHKWQALIFTSTDHYGVTQETEIEAHPAAGAWPLRVEQPDDPDDELELSEVGE